MSKCSWEWTTYPSCTTPSPPCSSGSSSAASCSFPGTFTSIRKSVENNHSNSLENQAAGMIVKSVKNIPLLVIGAIACATSVAGMAFLASKHLDNYVWLQTKLLIPGTANCFAGLVSTMVGVYSQQNGVWSPTAKITAIVEGSCLGVAIGLFVLIERFLRRVREEHWSHYDSPKA
ncbi:hypothetical protein J3458_002630 [Metarhizium acridum]|uniref:uncharacterized protein n=1 Tax=Metarhizium acridum TaxID=92637 RepID=UPI001C6AAEDA|nr:hypothetical protein J3458_002630 [Metarhizium acridum]